MTQGALSASTPLIAIGDAFTVDQEDAINSIEFLLAPLSARVLSNGYELVVTVDEQNDNFKITLVKVDSETWDSEVEQLVISDTLEKVICYLTFSQNTLHHTVLEFITPSTGALSE